jgi:hypothetical protein
MSGLSWKLPYLRRAPWCAVLAGPVCALLALFPDTARADSSIDARTMSSWRQVPPTTAAAMLRGNPITPGSQTPPQSSIDPTRYNNAMPIGAGSEIVHETPAFGGSLLMEMPRLGSDGTIQQPRFAFGFQSPAVRSFLQGLGVDAQQCLAPVLRGHAHFGSSPNATIGFAIRCTVR